MFFVDPKPEGLNALDAVRPYRFVIPSPSECPHQRLFGQDEWKANSRWFLEYVPTLKEIAGHSQIPIARESRKSSALKTTPKSSGTRSETGDLRKP